MEPLPDTAETREHLQLVDVAGAAAAAGVDRPPTGSTDAEVEEYLREALYVPGGNVDGMSPGPWRLSEASDQDARMRRELGVSWTQIDGWAQAGYRRHSFVIFDGSFDVGHVQRRLVQHGWSPTASLQGEEATAWYEWTGEGRWPSVPPLVDAPAGVTRRLAVDEGRLRIIPFEADMEASLAATDGRGSLADNDEFRLIAEALAHEPVFNLTLDDRAITRDELLAVTVSHGPGPKAMEWASRSGPILRPVMAYGWGWGTDAEGRVTTVLVLVHADSDAAQANGQLLPERVAEATTVVQQRPLAEMVTVERVEVEGRVASFWLTVDGGVSQWASRYRDLVVVEK
jgi:hypothetical protein